MTLSPPLTATELERVSLPGKQVELVRGQLVVREPPGTRHGAIAANLGYHLSDFARRQNAGIVLAQDTGFKIASDPSPSDTPAELLAKVADWLAAGSRLVWVIDPERAEARIYRKDGSVYVLPIGGSLDGEDVLPGFLCPLKDVLT